MGQPLSIPGQARASGRSSDRRAPSRAAMNGLPFSLGRNAVVRSAGLLSVSAAAKALASIAFVVLALRALGPSEGGQVILVFSIVRLAQAAVEGGPRPCGCGAPLGRRDRLGIHGGRLWIRPAGAGRRLLGPRPNGLRFPCI